jgi:hypothetical protein
VALNLSSLHSGLGSFTVWNAVEVAFQTVILYWE